MRNSLYNIKIDFDKSHGSFVFDQNTNKEYLDFMCMYSSLPLGYNHPIFDKQFISEISKVSQLRMTCCEYTSDEREEFESMFEKFSNVGIFKNFHYTCTGALAIEMAIKAAFSYKKIKRPVIISQHNSFHGITSFGNMVTGRTNIVGPRLEGFPGDVWPKFETIDDLKWILKNHTNIAGILIEPIQSTNGDIHYSNEFFDEIRSIANQFDVPLIFDEIQTGFCSTGKKWYFQHLNIQPDILAFGKKSQVCGIMTTEKYSEFFKTPSKMCITWDGDLIDMIRSKYIMKAIEQDYLINNANKMGESLLNGLNKMGLNARGKGLLIAFDFENRIIRDNFYNKLYDAGMLCNPTGEKSIRLRPNLNVSEDEINAALNIIRNASFKITC